MQSFNNFISDTSVIHRIEDTAKKFEGYSQDNYNPLLPADIESLLIAWLQNFEQFEGIDFNMVLKILETLEIVKDQQIRALFLSKVNSEILDKFGATINDIHICPLGEEYESSFRLSAFFNNKEEPPHYSSDINSLLKKISNKPNAVIVFFDDFLFSGGQLVCIFKKLLGIKLDPEDTDDIYSERVSIENPNLIEEFKKHKIALYYHLTFQSGYENEKFIQLKKEQGLNVEIFQGHIEKEDVGCFGTSEDVRRIKGKSNSPFHSGVFSNYKPAEVKLIYELLEEVGEQLLRNEHPESKKWNRGAFKRHSLGYGGKGKLIIGEQNVPTSTLTSLWLPSPENKNRKIWVRGKEIIWKSLFYRKPKRGGNEPNPILNEISYAKTPVKTVLANDYLIDTNSYDLMTLICLNRRQFINIYGHEHIDKINLAVHLNNLEQDFFDKSTQKNLFNKRHWYSYVVNSNDKLEIIEKLNTQLQKNIHFAIGLVLQLGDTNASLSSLSTVLSNLFANNPNKKFSVIIDCPTRNIETLKLIQKSLKKFEEAPIYISNQILLEEVLVENNASIFDDSKGLENIVYYLQSILGQKTDVKKLGVVELKSFEKVKLELKDSASTLIRAFSPNELIADFENVLYKSGSNSGDWQIFFNELLSVCNTYTPEFIEYLIYYSARSSNEFIRFGALKFARGREYLIDYWIEGAGCDRRNFQNISRFIEAPISFLMYPILRYYHRHKKIKGLNTRILEIIDEQLDGGYFVDYWLAEKILGNNSDNCMKGILCKDSIEVLKLVESGVDIFEEDGNSILESNLVTGVLMDKIILSTKMTSKKIDLFFKFHQHLLIL